MVSCFCFWGRPIISTTIYFYLPGASDSEGRDYKHALEMAKIMKNDVKSVDVFLLLFNGQRLRFEASILKLLKLYEAIFSKDMWKNVITEMTFWPHDKASIRKRDRKQNLTEETRHLQWNQEYKTK